MGLLQSSSDESGSGTSMDRPRKRQQQDLQPPAEKLKCPRCDSTNTKFCYYNNYNKSQPRHFCKSCKRHWTKGGMLRNVPVGGGRKNKRLKTSESLTITTHTNTKTGIGANIHVSGSSFGFQDSDQRLSQNQTILGHGSFFSSFNESNFNGLFGGSSTLQNHELQFPSPSLGSLDASGHISNLYGLSGLEESVMTGLNDKPWPSRESTATNWVWDDIDKFVSCDVSVPWDDAEIEYP